MATDTPPTETAPDYSTVLADIAKALKDSTTANSSSPNYTTVLTAISDTLKDEVVTLKLISDTLIASTAAVTKMDNTLNTKLSEMTASVKTMTEAIVKMEEASTKIEKMMEDKVNGGITIRTAEDQLAVSPKDQKKAFDKAMAG